MKQMRNTKLLKTIIIAIVIVIVLLIGIFAFLYLQTDMLKSNKTLFFKYIAQMGETKTSFIDEDITQYSEKKKNTPYTNEGIIKPNIEIAGEEFEKVDNLNISFEGKTDKVADKMEQNISINYSEDVKFPFMFRKIEDTVGIQTDYIGKDIVAVAADESSDIELIKGISDILEKLKEVKETKNTEMSEQEEKQILDKYAEVIKQNLDDKNFSKVKEADGTGYKLTITLEEIKKILTEILETLKDDEMLLNKLNEYLAISGNEIEIEKSNIEDVIENLNEVEIEENKQIEIIVYNKGGKLNKLQISIEGVNITIQKTKENDSVGVSMSFEIENEEATIKLLLEGTFMGLKDMQNVQETYRVAFEMGEESKIECLAENKVTFVEDAGIEEFTKDNSLFLNDFEKEQVTGFLQAVGERIEEVDKAQMEELGLGEDENPFVDLFTLPMFMSKYESANLKNDSGIFTNDDNYDESSKLVAMALHNNEYIDYETTNSPGATTKGLMTIISENNEEDVYGYKIKEINFNGEEYEATEENIALIKQEISTEKKYSIEFENEEGAIYRVIINER